MTRKQITAIPENWKNSKNVIERIAFAVDQQMSATLCESASDISNYGINGGFSGFVYYTDTCAFYNANKEDIWELAIDQAEELGEGNAIAMIANFGGAKNVGNCTQFENLMAWYAAEEAARYVAEYETEEEEEDEEE